MKYKIGDRLICKKSLNSEFSAGYIFLEDKEYVISAIRNNFHYVMMYIRTDESMDSGEWFTVNMLQEGDEWFTIGMEQIRKRLLHSHFYTDKELRRKKLDKLMKLYEI